MEEGYREFIYIDSHYKDTHGRNMSPLLGASLVEIPALPLSLQPLVELPLRTLPLRIASVFAL